ncbi:MAG: thiamine-phosphate kinase [Hydrogenobaculum sp.]|nr:MAG: thiamine-phosphate kinase [Hydrogenobaculum sp.]PMP89689.1 MAG: thiamine-phosphate kinase [Hydrogenobaculum sp.]
MIGEFELIKKLTAILEDNSIGDDTAYINIDNKVSLNITCDAFLEDVHFLRRYPPESIGFKSISINVSDIVANGGKPLYSLISLMIPDDIDERFIERIYEGVKSASLFYNLKIVGGNISKSSKLGIDVFLIGEVDRFVSRAGANVGDDVVVSGTLGDSYAGFKLLTSKKQYEEYELRLIERHLRPTARIDYINHIRKYASASMDISDGLSSDLWHIAERSNVVIDIDLNKIPISRELRLYASKENLNPYDLALSGGEDYQLLFCQKKEHFNPFLDNTVIGQVVEKGKALVLVNGKELERTGFDHFKNRQ